MSETEKQSTSQLDHFFGGKNMRRGLLLFLLLGAVCAGGVAPALAVGDEDRDAFVEQLILVAIGEIGNGREAHGYTKYADWSGGNKYGEWCSDFVSWCVAQADLQLSTNYLEYLYPMQTACATGVEWFTARGRYVTVAGKIKGYGAQWYRADGMPLAERPYIPMRGDLIYFEWYKYNRIDHVGIVEYVSMSADGVYTVHTIEGNNRIDFVERFTYPLDDPSIRAYGVLRDDIGIELRADCKGPIVEALQRWLVDHGYADFAPNGKYERKTKQAVIAFQEAYGLKPTGVADQVTQTAMGFLTGNPWPKPTPVPTEAPAP